MIRSIYIIGSLKNPKIIEIANLIQDSLKVEAFSDWFYAGPEADDAWRDGTKARGLTYKQALNTYSADTIFNFDKHHLDRCDAALLVMPAGKSGHLELGYAIGSGKPGFILFEEIPERYDVMVKFATGVFFNRREMVEALFQKYIRG
jgi:nucleoside 2-deoxyribosyltransferase